MFEFPGGQVPPLAPAGTHDINYILVTKLNCINTTIILTGRMVRYGSDQNSTSVVFVIYVYITLSMSVLAIPHNLVGSVIFRANSEDKVFIK